jgi:hypothetical protein
MPKRNRRSKTMRGGVWPFDSGEGADSSGDGWFGSLKKNASSASGWLTSDSSTPTTTTTTTPSTVGGRKRKSRRMRGGYSDNMSLTNLASRAAPYSGETARAQAYVGGKRTKRRCHKHKGSRRRHCRK